MNRTTFASAYTAGATTPAEVLEFHRATFGAARMDAEAGDPPDGVSKEEWDALGDPGKAALQRERQARAEAEQKLADATKPKPAPPKQQAPAQQPAPGKDPVKDAGQGDQQDIAAIIAAAVQQAIAPFEQRQQQWEADQAATRVTASVTAAAQAKFCDPDDALANVNLSDLTDGAGRPDDAKIAAALDAVLTAKPHLAKPFDGRRTPPAGAPFGGAPGASVSLDDRVKETLARMQASTNIRPQANA